MSSLKTIEEPDIQFCPTQAELLTEKLESYLRSSHRADGLWQRTSTQAANISDKRWELTASLIGGDISTIRSLLACNDVRSFINLPNEYRKTPLEEACSSHLARTNPHIITEFILAGADPNLLVDSQFVREHKIAHKDQFSDPDLDLMPDTRVPFYIELILVRNNLSTVQALHVFETLLKRSDPELVTDQIFDSVLRAESDRLYPVVTMWLISNGRNVDATLGFYLSEKVRETVTSIEIKIKKKKELDKRIKSEKREATDTEKWEITKRNGEANLQFEFLKLFKSFLIRYHRTNGALTYLKDIENTLDEFRERLNATKEGD